MKATFKDKNGGTWKIISIFEYSVDGKSCGVNACAEFGFPRREWFIVALDDITVTVV